MLALLGIVVRVENVERKGAPLESVVEMMELEWCKKKVWVGYAYFAVRQPTTPVAILRASFP